MVLLDVQMHGLDGFQTAQVIRAREQSRHTPIIFITAYDSDEFPPAQAYALGAVDYMVKPLVPVILRAKVAVFVDLFRVARNMTEHQRAEEALKEADRRKDDFLAMLGHELRNTLSPVRNAVQILQLTGPASPTLEKARDMIGRQVAHMVRLILEGVVGWYAARQFQETPKPVRLVDVQVELPIQDTVSRVSPSCHLHQTVWAASKRSTIMEGPPLFILTKSPHSQEPLGSVMAFTPTQLRKWDTLGVQPLPSNKEPHQDDSAHSLTASNASLLDEQIGQLWSRFVIWRISLSWLEMLQKTMRPFRCLTVW